jgi:hypothetical protein
MLTVHEKLAYKAVERTYNEYVGALLASEEIMTADEVASFVVHEVTRTNPKEIRFAGKAFIAGIIMSMILSETDYNFGEYNPKELFQILQK